LIELKINFFNLLIIASVFIGTTFGFLLILTKRINQKANVFLGLLAFMIVTWNIWVLSHDLNIFRIFPKFYLIPLNFSLVLGPFIFFYVKKICHPEHKFKPTEWLHFFPVLLEILVHVIMSKDAINNDILASDTESFFIWMPLVQLLSIISVSTYIIFSLREISIYHKWLKKNFSNDNKYNLRWLKRLLSLFGALWFLWVPYTLVDYIVFDFKLGISDYYPMYILMSLITIWISVEAFLKPEVVFLDQKIDDTNEKVAPASQLQEEAKWLTDQMETNLFFLNPDLTLSNLAEELEMHPNVLSKLINEGIGKSFSDFVNEYRTNSVKEKLNNSKYDHITLLGISFESGFNSKTTFNRVFKKTTGLTPAAYKQSVKK
jgi:AraC-like DNA-binding protein